MPPRLRLSDAKVPCYFCEQHQYFIFGVETRHLRFDLSLFAPHAPHSKLLFRSFFSKYPNDAEESWVEGFLFTDYFFSFLPSPRSSTFWTGAFERANMNTLRSLGTPLLLTLLGIFFCVAVNKLAKIEKGRGARISSFFF